MQTVIQLTTEEYEDLKNTKEEPSKLLTDTVTNLKTKLVTMAAKLVSTERELSTYVLAGAKPKEYTNQSPEDYRIMLETIYTYNAAHTKKVKEAISFTFDTLNKNVTHPQYSYESELKLKQLLKKWVAENRIKKESNNRYYLIR